MERVRTPAVTSRGGDAVKGEDLNGLKRSGLRPDMRFGRMCGGLRGRASALVVGLCIASLGGCADGRETVLLVRTSMPEELRDYVERTFEDANLDVDIRFTGGGELFVAAGWNTGDSDGRGPASDVWWGAPARTLQRAGNDGLLMPYRPDWVPPPGIGDPDVEAFWHATLVSPFVVAFSREQMTLARAPVDWIDLFHHRWAEEVHALDPVRSGEGSYFVGSFIVEGLRDDDDVMVGFDWLARLDGQVEVYAGDAEEVIRALGTGQALLGILPRYAVEAARNEDAPWLYYRVPESGTPVLTLGVAIVADSEAEHAARRFVDHLGRLDVATEAKLHTRWEPAYGEVDPTRFPADFEIVQSWRPQLPALDTLVSELPGWLERWDSEVRGR